MREANAFNWEPIAEVAKLFAGIFLTIIPVIAMLHAGRAGPLAGVVDLVTDSATGQPRQIMYFWMTGLLSAFLDNAPTYLVFFNLAGGDPAALMYSLQVTLAMISAGAVYFGALTYVGNAPNFMIKAIAESRGVKMPSFFGYLGYTSLVLLPLFASSPGSTPDHHERRSQAPSTRMCTRYGPCAPSTMVCSMSPVRDGPGNEVDRARHAAALAANQRERLFHAGHDAIGRQHGDVRVGQQGRRRRRVGARPA